MESVTTEYTPQQFEAIPPEMRERPQWVTYRTERRPDGKLNKIPVNPKTGYDASTTDSKTWGTFEEAIATGTGVAYVFVKDDPFFGMDRDDCRNPETGEIDPGVMEDVQRFDTYTEYSLSGTGLHIIGRGALLKPGNKKGDTEVYDHARFFVMTGNTLPGYETICDRQAELTAWHDKVWPKAARSASERSQPSHNLASDVLLEKAFAAKNNGDAIRRLYDGDITGYPSASEADCGFIAYMAFYTQDPARLANLWRASGLYRKKLDRDDYIQRTVMYVLDNYEGDTYSPGNGARLNFDRSGDARPEVNSSPDADDETATRLSRTLALSGNQFLTKSGEDWHPITNFVATIVADVTEDDDSGLTRRSLRIVGKLRTGHALPEILVPVDEFMGMGWIAKHGGSAWQAAIIEPGSTTRDKVRAAIEYHSVNEGIAHDRRYLHTGWRDIDGARHYLHGGGALGPDGLRTDVAVHLDRKLERYRFTDVPEGDELRDLGRRWLRLLDLGPERSIAPLISAVARAILGEFMPIDSGLFLYGRSGAYKSEVSALMLAHFGRGFTRLSIPLDWTATANALEGALYLVKDALAIVDDFAPAGSRYQIDSQHANLERIFRGIGNQSGRGRMNADGSLRPTFFPRGMVITSGEDVGRGYSASARMQTIEFVRSETNVAALSECQQLAEDGVFERVTAGFIVHLASDWERCREKVQHLYRESLRATRGLTFAHARTGDTIAAQITAIEAWFSYLAVVGVISDSERQTYVERMRSGLLDAGHRQGDALRDADPVTTFFDLTRAAIASEAAHLADKSTNADPRQSSRFGWRTEMIRTKDGVEPHSKPQGRRIGWIDHETDDVFLNLPATLAVVQTLGSSQGQTIPLSARTLARRIGEGGHIRSSESGRQLQKIYVAGGSQRVLHLTLSELFPPGDPDAQRELDVFTRGGVA